MNCRNAERDALLLRLAAAGVKPAEIARRDGLTRNVVIGALWRARCRQHQVAQPVMQQLWEDLRDGKDLVPVVLRKFRKPTPIQRGFR